MTANGSNNTVTLEIIRASEVTPREVKWLWYPYIPFGKITLLQGDPGDGKSKFMLALSALLTDGKPLPFQEAEEASGPMTVIYQTTEDDADDTVVPRFIASGGNRDNLMLDNQYALLFIRGERPIQDFKYDILKHPNVKLTTDGGAEPYRHGEDTHSIASIRFDEELLKQAAKADEQDAGEHRFILLTEEELEEYINSGTNTTPPPRPSSTRKYICPCCGNSVRATKTVNIACLDCDTQMELVK